MSIWNTSGMSSGRGAAGSSGLPSSHTPLHEAGLLQVRYEAEEWERGPDLPTGYGTDRCVLLVKEPETVLCYWELGGGALETAQKSLSDGQFRRARLVLRLVAGTGEERERRDLAPFRPGELATFFTVAPGSEYRTEIGLEVPGERYIPVIGSNLARTPRRAS